VVVPIRITAATYIAVAFYVNVVARYILNLCLACLTLYNRIEVPSAERATLPPNPHRKPFICIFVQRSRSIEHLFALHAAVH
jgi:hypothetical protein